MSATGLVWSLAGSTTRTSRGGKESYLPARSPLLAAAGDTDGAPF